MKSNAAKLGALGLLILLLSPAFRARAQGNRTWGIGPELGVNFAKFGRDAPDNDLKTGVVAGFSVTHSVIDNFGITAKALLTQRGARFESRMAGVSPVTTKTTLNYLEIPLLARFFLNKDGKFRPNLFAGPSFGFLFGGTYQTGSDDAVKIENYRDFLNPFDFGLTGGLGLNYEVATETRLLLDARYVYGLSNVNKAGDNYNNQGITVSVGVSFGF
ncbi:MAG: PorT family protein [Ferruginibacter sp.]|nr:PorT family protein [Cytophagales bacterium]